MKKEKNQDNVCVLKIYIFWFSSIRLRVYKVTNSFRTLIYCLGSEGNKSWSTADIEVRVFKSINWVICPASRNIVVVIM